MSRLQETASSGFRPNQANSGKKKSENDFCMFELAKLISRLEATSTNLLPSLHHPPEMSVSSLSAYRSLELISDFDFDVSFNDR